MQNEKTYFIGNQLIEYEEVETCTIEFCLEYLRGQKIVGLDIETGRKFPKGTYSEEVYRPGLDPYVSRIVMVQIGTLDTRFVIDARVVNCEFLREILENKEILKVGHNLKFEGKFFLAHYKIKLVSVWDVMICENILYNGERRSYALKALMIKYLGYEDIEEKDLFNQPIEEEEEEESDLLDLMDKTEKLVIDKSIRLGFVNIGDNPFTVEQIKYGIDDIVAPLRIREIQLKGRENYLPIIGMRLENKFTQVLSLMEITGMRVDVKAWLKLSEDNKVIYIKRQGMLDEYIVKGYPKFTKPPDLFGDRTCSIQWSSPAQVIKFFRYLEICPKEMSKQTKRMEWSVSAKALFKLLTPEYKDYFYGDKWQEFNSQQDFILNYLLMKKSSMLCTTFGKDWLKYVHPITSKVHSSYKQYMISSRLSSSSPNLQNIPKGEEFRHCFIADPGYEFLNCDYASQETRILADISNVDKLVDFFVVGNDIFGDDFHSYVATLMERAITKDDSIIITKKTNKKKREIAKGLNFALAYGASPWSIQFSISSTFEETVKFVQNYYDALPGLQDYFEKTKKLGVQRGWIELDPYTKCRYYFPDFDKMNKAKDKALSFYPEEYHNCRDKERRKLIGEQVKADYPEVSLCWKEYAILKGKLERRSLNLSIQGLAAKMTKLALIFIYDTLNEHRSIPNAVHDEIIGQCKPDDLEFKTIFKDSMIKAGTYFCKKVPMGAEVDPAPYWKH
jgi:DNA polymerase-1